MNDFNSIYIVGRLIADPKVKAIESSYVAKFKIANNSYRYNEIKKEYEQTTSFFDIVVFGMENENILKRVRAGDRIGVNGRLAIKEEKVCVECYVVQLLSKATEKQNLTEEVNDGEKKENEGV